MGPFTPMPGGGGSGSHSDKSLKSSSDSSGLTNHGGPIIDHRTEAQKRRTALRRNFPGMGSNSATWYHGRSYAGMTPEEAEAEYQRRLRNYNENDPFRKPTDPHRKHNVVAEQAKLKAQASTSPP